MFPMSLLCYINALPYHHCELSARPLAVPERFKLKVMTKPFN